MSGRTDKKLRKITAQAASQIRTELGNQMHTMIKTRKAWMPVWLWRWMVHQVINLDALPK